MFSNLSDSVHRLILGAIDRFTVLAPQKHAALSYGMLTILLMGLALLARLIIAPVGAGLQYLTFFPAVTLAAIIGGYRAGLLAILIGLALATYIFTPPHFAISIEVLKTSFWSNMVFLIEGLVVSFSIEALHLYRQKYRQELKESRNLQASTMELNEQLSKQIAKGRQHEEILRESEARLRAIIEVSPVPFALNDEQQNITYLNSAFIRTFGYTLEDIPNLTKWWHKAYPDPAYRQQVTTNWQANLEKARREGRPFESLELAIRCKDGSSKTALVAAVPIGASFAGTHLVSLFDITERKMIERNLAESLHQLEEKELSKGRFFAAAGHDLRQPLAAANLFIDALKFTEATPRQNKIIQNLDLAMVTFQGLLDSLLNISKLDSGAIKPQFSPINIIEVFNWLERNFAPMASEKRLGFKLYFPMKETLAVLSDIALLNSILMNLVSNAIKFTSKGAILVSARKRGSDVLFQVWDTGIGIADKNITLIFTEFYQTNNPQRDRTSGLGLGLAIAERAATLLGSKITCHSRIGRGSVFEFRLPLDGTASDEVQQAAAIVPQKKVINVAFVQGKRFVVVEDDLLVSQALTQSLEGLGGEVERFRTAEDALLHANIGYTDFYLVDYMLGGTLNGIQLLNLLQKKSGKPIKAVLMTGDTSSDLIRKTANLSWPVLFKPANTFKLISSLEAQEDQQT